MSTTLTFIKMTMLAAIVIFFGCLVYISLFNHPTADDYFLGYHAHHLGFWGYQQYIYLHWGGRYFSNFMGAAFAYEGFLFSHYFFHTVLLLMATMGSIWYGLSTAQVCFLQHQYKGMQLLLAACFISIVGITICPEPATAFFWFSSSITYQLSIVMLLLATSLLLQIFWMNKHYQWFRVLCLSGITVAINGSNEVAALCWGIVILTLWWLCPTKKLLHNKIVWLISIVYMGTFCIAWLAPGNLERRAGFGETNYLAAISIAFVRTLYVFWNILQSPTFLIAALGSFALGASNNSVSFTTSTKQFFFILIPIAVFAIHIPIMCISNGSLPERATNVIVWFTGLSLLIAAFFSGLQFAHLNAIQQLAKNNQQFWIVAILVMSATMVCNRASKEMFYSALEAKLHNSIMTERETLLQHCQHQQPISIPSYAAAKEKHFKILYGLKPKATLRQWLMQPPTLLYTFDDLETAETLRILQQYYHTGNISVIP